MDEIRDTLDIAEIKLMKQGYYPVSPIDEEVNPDLSEPLPVLMGNDIRALLECEAFCYIGTDKELEKHKGCILEYQTAMIYGKEIVML